MCTPKHLEQGQREEERVIRKVVGGANDEKVVEITSAPGWATARLCGHAAKTGWSPPYARRQSRPEALHLRQWIPVLLSPNVPVLEGETPAQLHIMSNDFTTYAPVIA